MASLRLLLELISLIFLLILLDLNLLLVVLAHDRHSVSISWEALLLRPYLALVRRCFSAVASVLFNLTLWCSCLMLIVSITPLYLRVSLSIRFTFLWLHMLLWLLLCACVLNHLHLSLDLTQDLVHASSESVNTFDAIHGCNCFTHRTVCGYVVEICLREIPWVLSHLSWVGLNSYLLFAILHVIWYWFTYVSFILWRSVVASLLLLSVIMCLEVVSNHIAALVASYVLLSQLTALSWILWLGRLSYILCLDHIARLASSVRCLPFNVKVLALVVWVSSLSLTLRWGANVTILAVLRNSLEPLWRTS